MCPACAAALALVAAKAGSAGGLAALVVTKLRTKTEAKNPDLESRAEAPDRKEMSR